MTLDPAILKTLLTDMLGKRRRELQDELRAARGDALPARSRDGAEVVDRKDLAEALSGDALADAEDLRDRRELAAVESALRRLDHGDYGRCEDCGGVIGQARLLAVPTAQRCTACQAVRERRTSDAGR